MYKFPKRLLAMNLLPRKYLPAPEENNQAPRIEDALSFLIKVCGVTSEEEAETAVAAGANAIGFNFDESNPRYIEPERARQIVRAVRGSYLKVGVFMNPSEDELLETAGRIPLNVLQLHGDSAPLHLAKSLSVWQPLRADHVPDPLSPDVSAWVLDTASMKNGHSERTFEWSTAASFPGRAIIAGALEAENVIAAIQTVRPWGVDACTTLESRIGHKDLARVKDFVQAALAGFQLCQVEKPA